ncbi:MAG: MATE family efflux transporter [Fusobacteriaceae bacterium]
MKNNLLVGEIRHHYFKYLFPSVAGTLAYGLLIFIDTIFVGRGIGSLGIAALNISIPVFSMVACGMFLGIGGATTAALNFGKNKKEEKNKIFTLCVYLGLFISLFFSIITSFNLDKIVHFLGARGEVIPLVKDYVSVISKTIVFYIIPHILTNFIKNDYNPKLPMYYLICVSISNVFLDYLFIFIFKWGMTGAAAATSISQFLGILILLTHFKLPQNTLKLKKKFFTFNILYRIGKIGLPSFISEISLGTVVIISNAEFYKYLGNLGVSAYGIIININFLLYLIYSGIAQSSQPIVSSNFGANQLLRVKETLKLGIKIVISSGIIFYLILVIFRTNIITLFNNENNELIKLTKNAFPLFFSGVVLLGLNLKFSSFFQSIEFNRISSLLNLLRSFLLVIFFIKILPKFIGISGVWLAYSSSELVTFIIAILYYKKVYKKYVLNNQDNIVKS